MTRPSMLLRNAPISSYESGTPRSVPTQHSTSPSTEHCALHAARCALLGTAAGARAHATKQLPLQKRASQSPARAAVLCRRRRSSGWRSG
eukprot:2372586-Rhodomonas_salina.1